MIVGSELQQFSIFQDLHTELLDLLAGYAIRKHFKANTTIFTRGETPQGFVLICSGQVKVYCDSIDGNHQILSLFETGQSFGEAALFMPGYPANARTLVDTEILWIPKLGFQDLLGKNPELALRLVITLASRQRKLVRMVEDLTLRNARGRLCHYLSQLLKQQNSRALPEIQIPVPQTTLAKLLGVTEETLSRTIKSLKKDGIITTESKGQFGIKDLDALEKAYAI